jgi:hypothetical protein
MRWLGLVPLLLLAAACSTTRQYNITAQPSDAVISLDDGLQRGQGTLLANVTFTQSQSVRHVTAVRAGYQDKTISLNRDDPTTTVQIQLDPFHRKLNFTVGPVPAVISIDGVPLTAGPVQEASADETFTQDNKGAWTRYTVTATREGWEPTTRPVTWTDPSADYVLELRPKRKDVTITTNPPGATVAIDDETIGTGPALKAGVTFPYDNANNQYADRKVTISKAGYDAIQKSISWDDGKTDYEFDLLPHEKSVRIHTDPAGAVVSINGKPATPGPDGVPTADLTYVPVNDKGDLPVFTATISKSAAETEWYPATLQIPWEDGKSEYSSTLTEIITRHVPQDTIALERDSDGVWQLAPRETDTIAMKDVTEGPDKQPPSQLYKAPKGSTIESLVVSPDGSQVLFSQLAGNTKVDLRSQILAISTFGPENRQEVTDGRALDLMPAYTPDGSQMVFSSNRAGRRLNIWRKSLVGGVGIEQLTTADEQDLWPTVDALAKARLFYEVRSDSQPEPQLYTTFVDGGSRTDLSSIPVSQPHISPRADAIIFTSVNQRTGNRGIFRIPDKGGPAIDLSNDPDSDCYDPAWSRDGSVIAYACDRGYATYPVWKDGAVSEERHRNPDIWIINMDSPDKPIQMTSNGSIDDCPAIDPKGNYIYFRSNRGGQWGIWKIALK